MGNYYKNNIDYYERNASRYEYSSWYFFNEYKDNTLRHELKQCVDSIRKTEITVLEIGPGTGYLLAKLINIGNIVIDYTGIEHSSEMTKILLSKYKHELRNMKVLNASVSSKYIKDNFTKNKYDLIIGSSILHHLPDYDAVIEQLSGLLNMNGVMYFVREPIHKSECERVNIFQKTANYVYESVNAMLLKPVIKNILWPKKVKQEDTRNIAVHMFRDGVSINPMMNLCKAGFKVIIFRKYNRRASAFMSYLENKWLRWTRMDIYGNTLFSVGVQKIS